jgi:hypothetical protein
VAHLYARLGFAAPADAVEVVHLADLTGVPAPLSGLRVVRTVGINGTRFSAHLGSERVGLLEVEVLDPAERRPRGDGLADIANLEVLEATAARASPRTCSGTRPSGCAWLTSTGCCTTRPRRRQRRSRSPSATASPGDADPPRLRAAPRAVTCREASGRTG